MKRTFRTTKTTKIERKQGKVQNTYKQISQEDLAGQMEWMTQLFASSWLSSLTIMCVF